MEAMRVDIEGITCEHPTVVFESTGSQGGDAGHGGEASIEFSMLQGGSGFSLIVSPDNRFVRIAVQGDWELEGLALALLDLGRALMARDDVLEDRARWHRP